MIWPVKLFIPSMSRGAGLGLSLIATTDHRRRTLCRDELMLGRYLSRLGNKGVGSGRTSWADLMLFLVLGVEVECGDARGFRREKVGFRGVGRGLVG